MQGRLYRSLKLWSFYCDLEESLGTMESTQAVYDRILELRIATPQLILNYALFLQVRPCWLGYQLSGKEGSGAPCVAKHLSAAGKTVQRCCHQ